MPIRTPERMHATGRSAWALVGIALVVAIIVALAKFFAGILVPTIVAAIIAVLVLPLTDALARRIPRGWAVGATLLLIAALAAALTWMFASGILDQLPAIEATLKAAQQSIEQWLSGSATGQQVQKALDSAGTASSALTLGQGWIGSALHSVVPLFMGVFIATMVLFLVLLDPTETQGWFARAVPWPVERSQRFVATFGQVIRDYYKGATILALVNSVPIWIVALVLGIQGAPAIAVVLFATSYIPYIGAWLGGAFAVLMALGSGGTTTAWFMLGAVLVVNLGLQSIVQPFAFSATLRVSALGVFLVTLLGGALAGAFGAMMAGPVMAMAARFRPDVLLAAPDDGSTTPLPAGSIQSSR